MNAVPLPLPETPLPQAMTAPDAPLPPGAMIGPYRIETAAEAGPDGPAYRAQDAASARRVIVREFAPRELARRSADGRTIEAFDPALFAAGLAEIRRLGADFAAFRHPNVVALLDCVDAQGTVALAFDVFDGRTLEQLLRPGETLTPDEVQEIVPALLGALRAIHAAGLLHLDVCPGSVAIRRDGTPLLARRHLLRRALGHADPGAPRGPRDAFRAEEHFAADGRLGPWTDIYAFAATLYRLAVGVPPPTGRDRRRAVVSGEHDPAGLALDSLTGTWPVSLVTAIRHGLAIPAENRPQSIAALTAAFGAGSPAEIRTVPLRDPGARARTGPPLPPDEAPTVAIANRPPLPRRARLDDITRGDPTGPPETAGRVSSAASEAPTKILSPSRPPRRPDAMTAPGAAAAPPGDDIATVRIAPRTRPPILEPPSVPPPAPPEDAHTTIIYRRGRATTMTGSLRPPQAPAALPETSPVAAAPGPVAGEADAAILPARFSLFHPQALVPGLWHDLAVYLHEPGIDSVVRQDHFARFEARPPELPERRSALRYSLKAGAPVTIVPELPGCRINPPHATVQWWENFQRVGFRITANPGAPGFAAAADGAPLHGTVSFFVGPLLVGETAFAVTAARGRIDPAANIAAFAADTFAAVFPCYAPQDGEISDRLPALAAHFDHAYLAEILVLRSAGWDRDLLKYIERAERFQLLWSSAASRSPHVEEEWNFARALGRPDFLRAHYWRHPAPGLPAELAAVPLRYLVLPLE